MEMGVNNFLEIKNVSFSYKNTSVIEDFSLSVEKGSFTTLLGSSGCGKTTLLRLISGFYNPNSGGIYIDSINQKGISPENRKIGMVFQDYALFPHLTVRQNIEFGLKLLNKSEKTESLQIEAEMIKMLGIENLLSRFPHELSGGQQQRVALARALVLKPKVLLMDEPLSSLDAKLRSYIREELKEIQKALKITTIYVTHDQEEALSLSDKIAVLNEGKLLQYGTPEELYFEPKNKFTADFIGKANFLIQGEKRIMIRPEWLSMEKIENDKTDDDDILVGKIVSSSFLGEKTRVKVSLDDGSELENEFLEADIDTVELKSNGKSENICLKIRRRWVIS